RPRTRSSVPSHSGVDPEIKLRSQNSNLPGAAADEGATIRFGKYVVHVQVHIILLGDVIYRLDVERSALSRVYHPGYIRIVTGKIFTPMVDLQSHTDLPSDVGNARVSGPRVEARHLGRWRQGNGAPTPIIALGSHHRGVGE